MTAVALLLALQMPSHVEAPPGDVGEVRRDFRGTMWKAVSGCHAASGHHKSVNRIGGTIYFTPDDDVLITLEQEDDTSSRQVLFVRRYRHDPRAQLPFILPDEQFGSPQDKGGQFREHNQLLLLELDMENEPGPWLPKSGKVILLLKQVK